MYITWLACKIILLSLPLLEKTLLLLLSFCKFLKTGICHYVIRPMIPSQFDISIPSLQGCCFFGSATLFLVDYTIKM